LQVTYQLARIFNKSGKDVRFTWPKIIKLAGVWSEVDHGLDITRFVVQNTKDTGEIKPGIDIPHATPEFKGIGEYQVAATRKVALFELGAFDEQTHGFTPATPVGGKFYFWDNNNNAINGVTGSTPLFNVNFWNGGPGSLWLYFDDLGLGYTVPTFQLPSKT
jgi:hypothetical protein